MFKARVADDHYFAIWETLFQDTFYSLLEKVIGIPISYECKTYGHVTTVTAVYTTVARVQ